MGTKKIIFKIINITNRNMTEKRVKRVLTYMPEVNRYSKDNNVEFKGFMGFFYL